MKPHLACDADLTKIKLPILAMPKIDGVRALHINGKFSGRSLKGFDNKALMEYFDRDIFANLDGELTIGSVVDGETCRRTTSGVSTINGPGGEEFTWWIFDNPLSLRPRYIDRLYNAQERVGQLRDKGIANVKVVPYVVCCTIQEVEQVHMEHMRQGYEGTILRSSEGLHKSGRATPKEAAFLRIKDFAEEEAIVLSIEEGEENQNVAKTNPLGYTERSSHKENKVPNGMVGALICKDLKTGQELVVSAGRMTHDERKYYFENQNEILGRLIKYKAMMYGKKDLPRFPTFQLIRPKVDMPAE